MNIEIVKLGDRVKATGLGEVFSKLSGGCGRGVVIHTEKQGLSVANDELQAEVDAELFSHSYLFDGIFFKDDMNGGLMWVAREDFEIL